MQSAYAILEAIDSDARYAELDDQLKGRVDIWRSIVRGVLNAPTKARGIADQSAKLGHIEGFSPKTIERVFYRFVGSLDWYSCFLDRRGRTLRRTAVTDGEKQLFKRYACENQRGKLYPAWKRLLEDLRAGLDLEGIGPDGDRGTWRNLYMREFPGRLVPAVCPMDYVPRGWDYTSFWRHRPTKFEMKAVTVGRGAAKKFRPGVMTTRVGSYVGQGIFIDDLWHDQLVNVLGVNRSAHWPLELAAIDFTSGCRFAWGHKPELETDNGVRERIRNRETLFFLAFILTTYGWHPDGTTFFVEHGATGVTEQTEEQLRAWTGGRVTFERSGIQREEAFAGLYEGRGRGNPDFKALLEGSHSYFQNAIAHLPGRKGKDWDSTPAGLDKMTAHNRNLIAAMAALPPDLAAQLRLPIPQFSRWKAAVDAIYTTVNNRTDHELEGWEQLGNVVQQFRIVESSQEWIDERAFLSLPQTTQAMLHSAVQANPSGLSRSRRLSPHEVWTRGSQGWPKLPPWCVPQMLGADLGATVRVADSHEIGFPGGDVYEAEVLTSKNRIERLVPGDCFLAHVLPAMPQFLILSREAGGYVGVCKRRERVAKFDEAALSQQVREVCRTEAELLKPIARRGRAMQEQIREDREWNIRVLESATGQAAAAAPVAKSEAAQVDEIDPIAEALRRKKLAEATT